MIDYETSAFAPALIQDMQRIFGDDHRRIDHAMAVLDYANRIQSVEGGDAVVVRAAAILHDIGIQEAERKYGSSAGRYQEIEGPPIAEPVLRARGLDEERIAHVCRIIANHHSAGGIDTPEFRILWDADALVNLGEIFQDDAGGNRAATINKIFKTETGRKMAMSLYVDA